MRNERMSRTSTGAPGSQSNRIGDARAWAFFVQDEISWGRLTLTPGVRYENIDLVRTDYSTSDPDRSEGPTRVRENHVEVVIPGVGARYEFNENISFVGGVFRGFGPPGPGSNEFTDAEESVNYELGLRVRGEFAEIQATAFFNDYRNLLGIDTLSSGGTGEGDFFNGGEAFVHGLELSGSADLGAVTNSNFSIPLSFAYTGTSAVFDNTFESDYQPWGSVQKGDSIPYIPSSQFHASLAFGRARWRLRADTTYVGRMRTQAGQGPIDPFQATDSYLTLALTGEYDFRQERSHSTLFVSVRNLTDEKYIVARRPAGARPGLPRTLMAGIRFSFGR